MKRVKMYLLLLGALFLYGCPTPCKNLQQIEIQDIPDSILKYIPYKNGETYRLRHSNGLIISYKATRNTTKQISIDHHCRCCNSYKYPIVKVMLSPAYAISPIQIQLSQFQNNFYLFHLTTMHSSFELFPHHQSKPTYPTLTLNEKNYNGVFTLKSRDTDREIDSIFYNTEIGIIKIFLKNGDNYVENN